LFSEVLGTFMLVLVAAGGGILHAKGQISLAAAVVAPGLMVMAIILFMGAISGAHLNPGVSLAFAARGDFPWKRVPWYGVAQLVGATLACLFPLAVFGNVEHLGATLPGAGYHAWQALLMEIALTAVLVSVILGTASGAQNVGSFAALAVGGLRRSSRALVSARQRRLNESRPLVRSRTGRRRLVELLGVHSRTPGRSGARGSFRVGPPRTWRRSGLAGCWFGETWSLVEKRRTRER
jgi:hypothetical protein